MSTAPPTIAWRDSLSLKPAATRLLLAAGLLAGQAQAATLPIDSFSTPAAPRVSVLTSVATDSFENLTASVPGGVRWVYQDTYINPLNSAVVLAVGNGQLSSSSGVQARTEVAVGYGNASLTGPRLGLDARPYNAFRFEFSGVSTTLNIVASLFTANPLDPGTPVYYTNAAINIAPPVAGGPLVFDLPFTLGDPFNFAQVDGIRFIINRANGNSGINFNLDSFSLVTSVPEPSPALLLLAGIGVMALLLRRTAQARA